MSVDPPSHPDRLIDPDSTPSERNYALLLHLSLLGVLVIAIPVILPVILWQLKRNESPFLDDHAREAVNFQISLLLYSLIAIPLYLACGIGAIISLAVPVLGVVGCVLASLAASRGEFYRYPMTLRLI